jgi:hypothetical protein
LLLLTAVAVAPVGAFSDFALAEPWEPGAAMLQNAKAAPLARKRLPTVSRAVIAVRPAHRRERDARLVVIAPPSL